MCRACWRSAEMWKRVTPLRHSWLPKHYRRWWQQLAAITGRWWRNGRFENTSGIMKFQKKTSCTRLEVLKKSTNLFVVVFLGGQKKSAWILSRFWNVFQHGNCFLLNDDTHLTKAGGIVCCWWRGIGIVLRFSKWSFQWFAWFWGKCMWF